MSAQQSQGGEPADLVGTVINDRYQIIERLSEGGMGVVYRAQHTVLQSPFAIKVLLHPQMKKAQQRFLMEARLASKINHPNTVYIADFGVLSDDRPYLAMEFLAGPTLSSLIKSGPMDQLRAAQITLQIARGLQAVHDKGIIHCDISIIYSVSLRKSQKTIQRRRRDDVDASSEWKSHILDAASH